MKNWNIDLLLKLIGVPLFLCLFVSMGVRAEPGGRLQYLPIQDSGRVKPFDTFSKEMLELVYGKKSYEKRSAMEIILTWTISPTLWQDKPLFELRNRDILTALNLNFDKRYFTGEEIFGSPKFTELMQDLQGKRESKEKLTPYFQALQRLESQYSVFREIASGRMLRLIPQKESDTWLSVDQFNSEQQGQLVKVTKALIQYLAAVSEQGPDRIEAGAGLDKAVDEFIDFARQNAPEKYGNPQKIETEVFYNQLHPFRWTYILYLSAAILLLCIWLFDWKRGMPAVWALSLSAFLMHAFGFGLRVYLMDRPPVSNMYETVVWMSWGCVLFSMIIEWIYRFRFVLLAGLLGGVVALVIADSAPVVLDPSLHPLEPVLRSNYWLIVHVMTITISYAAFFLAFVLGDIGLIYYGLGEQKYHEKLKALVTAIYRAMQIGVMFLAPGIILGGIWADYSWGRFWGWDPKETWALIALLGYLAVLHGRLIGWVRQFGMVVCSVVTFNLVIMAWYGVNFVLGAGLHSYGFGAGGIEYVAAFSGLHLLVVGYLALQRKNAK